MLGGGGARDHALSSAAVTAHTIHLCQLLITYIYICVILRLSHVHFTRILTKVCFYKDNLYSRIGLAPDSFPLRVHQLFSSGFGYPLLANTS